MIRGTCCSCLTGQWSWHEMNTFSLIQIYWKDEFKLNAQYIIHVWSGFEIKIKITNPKADSYFDEYIHDFYFDEHIQLGLYMLGHDYICPIYSTEATNKGNMNIPNKN